VATAPHFKVKLIDEHINETHRVISSDISIKPLRELDLFVAVSTFNTRNTSALCRNVNLCVLRTDRRFSPVLRNDTCPGSSTKSVGRSSSGSAEAMNRQTTSSRRDNRCSGVHTSAGRTFAPVRSLNG
jgi:hypothetical protein